MARIRPDSPARIAADAAIECIDRCATALAQIVWKIEKPILAPQRHVPALIAGRGRYFVQAIEARSAQSFLP